jgi:hypothetical protein
LLLAIYPPGATNVLKVFLLRYMEHPPSKERKHHLFYFGMFALDFFWRYVQGRTQALEKGSTKDPQTACHRRDG